MLPTVIADFLASLGPASAGAALLQQGLQLTFDRNASISVPSFVAAAGNWMGDRGIADSGPAIECAGRAHVVAGQARSDHRAQL